MIVNSNPGFEWAGGYTQSGSGSLLTLGEATARTGCRSFYLWAGTFPSPYQGWIQIPTQLKPWAGLCTVSLWVMVPVEATYGAVEVRRVDSLQNEVIAQKQLSDLTPGVWTLITGEFVPRGHPTIQYVSVTALHQDMGAAFYLDDVTIETGRGVYVVPPVALEGAMPLTDIQLANMALARLSVSPPIESFSEQTESAQACQLFFDASRDATLESFDWPFASRQGTLVRVEDAEEGSSWDRAYAWPADDCLVVRKILQADGSEPTTPIVFITESHPTHGRIIRTNEVDAKVRYTARVEDVRWWPTLFGVALSWQLAAEIAPALRVAPDLQAMCYTQFAIWLHKAYAAALAEGYDPAPLDADWIRARTTS